MNMKTLFNGTLFADYHQFYLTGAERATDYSDGMTEQALAARLVWKDEVLAVVTARDMDVPITVEFFDAKPEIDLDNADHVVEAGLRSSGTLAIAGCTDYFPDAARFSVPAGDLEARVVMTGLGTISEDGLDGHDRYVIQLWPGKAQAVQVLKQWQKD